MQFESLIDFFTTVAPAVVAFISTLIGSSAWHDVAAKQNITVSGYRRTK